MTVNEAIKTLAYGADFEIRGAYSGKTYHKSYYNNSKNLDKYAEMEVISQPYYTDLIIKDGIKGKYCSPVIVIYMHDYDLCVKRGDKT